MWTSGWIVELATMMVCVIAQHLGLTEAISSVLARISKCYRCVTFWGTLTALLALKKGIFEALFLSILMSYLSNFFALSLLWMQRQYNILWEKVERGKRRSGRALARCIRREMKKAHNKGCYGLILNMLLD